MKYLQVYEKFDNLLELKKYFIFRPKISTFSGPFKIIEVLEKGDDADINYSAPYSDLQCKVIYDIYSSNNIVKVNGRELQLTFNGIHDGILYTSDSLEDCMIEGKKLVRIKNYRL